MIKKLVVTSHAFFTAATFSKVNSFAHIYRNTTFVRSDLLHNQKDCHQDNISFGCLQFYKQNCLSILVSIFIVINK